MAFSCFINLSLFDFSSKPSKKGDELGRCCVTLFIFPFLKPTINILSIIIACEGMMACTLVLSGLPCSVGHYISDYEILQPPLLIDF